MNRKKRNLKLKKKKNQKNTIVFYLKLTQSKSEPI